MNKQPNKKDELFVFWNLGGLFSYIDGYNRG